MHGKPPKYNGIAVVSCISRRCNLRRKITTMDIVFGIILLIAAVFLVVAVLMQSGKSHNLSGAIAGGAETFFGKEKGKTMDKLFSKLTTVVSIIFVILVIIVYVIQPDTVYDPDDSFNAQFSESGDAAVLDNADTAADAADTAADAADTTADAAADAAAE